jgi:hypothetical protein
MNSEVAIILSRTEQFRKLVHSPSTSDGLYKKCGAGEGVWKYYNGFDSSPVSNGINQLRQP